MRHLLKLLAKSRVVRFSGTLLLLGNPASAGFDPVYSCVVERDLVVLTDNQQRIPVPAGTWVRVQFLHRCNRYCGANVTIAEHFVRAATLVFDESTDNIPRDRLWREQNGVIIWHHENAGSEAELTEIRLNCEGAY